MVQHRQRQAIVGRGDIGFVDEGVVAIGGSMVRAELPYYSAIVTFPKTPWPRSEEILVALGDALEAHTGVMTPHETFLALRSVHFGYELSEELAGLGARLPRLENCMYGGLEAVEQPEMLGWLNYWSEASCRFLGFPDGARDAELLAQSYRTPKGAWLVKATAEPLDAKRPEHIDALSRAYANLPRLGVRRALE